jgi:ABC-type transporter Mla subunit MlaD
MSSTTNHWKLGLFIVTGIAVVLGSATWIGIESLRRDFRVAFSYFDEPVNGLDVGSPVKYLGVPLGKVVGIRGAPELGWIEVEAHLYVDGLEDMGLRDPANPLVEGEGLFVPDGLYVQLVSSPLTGVSYIEAGFFDVPIPENLPFPTNWNTVRSVPSTLETLGKGLVETLDSIPPLAEQATQLMNTLDQTLIDLDLRDIAQRTRDLLTITEAKVSALDTGGLSTDARATLDEVRGFMIDLRAEDGAVNRLVDRIDELSTTLETAVESADLQSTTASLRQAGSSVDLAGSEFAAFSRDLRGDVDLLRETLDSIRRLAVLLERDPGALIFGRTPQSGVRRNR